MKDRKREQVITHLQIIHTWASVDPKSPKEVIYSFRALEDIRDWTMDAIKMLQEDGDGIRENK